MNRISLCAALLIGSISAAFAQSNPVVTATLPGFNEFVGASPRPIELNDFFQDPDFAPSVHIQTNQGAMDLVLFDRRTPKTVTNFLAYVNGGRYFLTDPTTKQQASTFFHRSVPGFVIQTGGFIGTANTSNTGVAPTAVATNSPVANEPGISNLRGTVAMAKVGNDPNSATSQWFVNLADNSANLDAQNGGFTVFGRVLGTGMATADRIAALSIFNFGSPFDSLPLQNYDGISAVKVPNLITLPQFAQAGQVHSPVSYSASVDNSALTDVSVSDHTLLVTAKQPGTVHITVTATDLDGGRVSQTFTVNNVAAPGHLANISTRLRVGTDENVLIAGFIVRGGTSKRLVIRGIGPSLVDNGITSPLQNPVIELHDANNVTIATNDNWNDNDNEQEIIDAGFAPRARVESALLTTVPSNDAGIAYTVILKGANLGVGIGVVEVYDLDSSAGSSILNISTRGKVLSPDPNELIGGFIVGGGDPKRYVIRAIGPSLTKFGIAGALANPTLELHDANGATIDSNNDWQSSPQMADIQASGLAPTDPKESAIVRTLAPAAYTAIVRGLNNTEGVGSVEIYQNP